MTNMRRRDKQNKMEMYRIITGMGLFLGEHGNFKDAKKIALQWLENNIGIVRLTQGATFSIDTFEKKNHMSKIEEY